MWWKIRDHPEAELYFVVGSGVESVPGAPGSTTHGLAGSSADPRTIPVPEFSWPFPEVMVVSQQACREMLAIVREGKPGQGRDESRGPRHMQETRRIPGVRCCLALGGLACTLGGCAREDTVPTSSELHTGCT